VGLNDFNVILGKGVAVEKRLRVNWDRYGKSVVNV
jgi:hypothetical protein